MMKEKGRDDMQWTPKTLADFKFLSDLQLSPSGKRLLYTRTTPNLDENRYDRMLYTYDTEQHLSLPLTAGPKDQPGQWENESTVLFASGRNADKDKNCTEFYRIGCHGGEAELAFTLPFAGASVYPLGHGKFLVQTNSPNKETIEKKKEEEPFAKDWETFEEIPFWNNGGGYARQKSSRLYMYDESTDECTTITGANGHAYGVTLNASKDKALFLYTEAKKTRPLENQLGVLDIENLTFTLHSPFEQSRIAFAEFWGDDIIIAAHESKRQGLNELSDLYRMEEDVPVRLFEHDYEIDFGGSVGSDLRYGGGRDTKIDGDYLYAIVTDTHRSSLVRYDRDGNFENLSDTDGSVDDFDVLDGVYYTIGLHDMRGQEIYDAQGNALTSHNPKQDVFPIETFTFTTRDQEKTGFYIAPKHTNDEKTPALLLIHGGPKTVYGDVLIHEMQCLAEAGYYVFFTNPHGSDGYGREFMDIRGKYGTIDYDDLMACTDALLEKVPTADSDRLGVMGGSYGGFMTNWIIGHTDRFKAACSQRCISNWVSFFGTSDIGYYFTTDQIGADPWSDPDTLWEKSPIRYADQVKTPTLFLHSDEDYRCWLPEGLQMYTALRYFDVPTRMVVFHGENHELSRSGKPQSRIKRLEEILAWFDAYLKEEKR